MATAVETQQGTIVFTDLSGFTEYTALQGDDAAVRLLDLQDKLVSSRMDGKGRIVKNLGDGLMLWFDNPCDAIEVSLALQEEFEQHSGEEEVPLWVRIGIHYGAPARRGADLIGHDVNVAARIVELAAPGEVLASDVCATRAGAMDGIHFEEVGPTIMKGIPEPVDIFRVMRASDL